MWCLLKDQHFLINLIKFLLLGNSNHLWPGFLACAVQGHLKFRKRLVHLIPQRLWRAQVRKGHGHLRHVALVSSCAHLHLELKVYSRDS